MASYERTTSAAMAEVLAVAQQLLTERLPLQKTAGDRHAVTLQGEDGRVTITVHRHGLETQVIADTDQLRTSRLDTETQYFLGKLPYQPGNTPFSSGDRG
jgi:hypothetical protein